MFRKEPATGGASDPLPLEIRPPSFFGLDDCCKDVVVGCLCEVCSLCATHYQQILICEDIEREVRQAKEHLRRLLRQLKEAQAERSRTYREADQAFSTWTTRREPVPR